MDLEKLVKPDSVLCNAQARSKKHCFEILSQLLAQDNPDVASEEIFAKLVDRERLGCTSLQQGVAFPHCRVSGVSNSVGALIKLSEAIDFDSQDGQPVDLAFAMIVPTDVDASHHADMQTISGILNDDALRVRLRAANSSSDLYDALLLGHVQPIAKTQQA